MIVGADERAGWALHTGKEPVTKSEMKMKRDVFDIFKSLLFGVRRQSAAATALWIAL